MENKFSKEGQMQKRYVIAIVICVKERTKTTIGAEDFDFQLIELGCDRCDDDGEEKLGMKTLKRKKKTINECGNWHGRSRPNNRGMELERRAPEENERRWVVIEGQKRYTTV